MNTIDLIAQIENLIKQYKNGWLLAEELDEYINDAIKQHKYEYVDLNSDEMRIRKLHNTLLEIEHGDLDNLQI